MILFSRKINFRLVLQCRIYIIHCFRDVLWDWLVVIVQSVTNYLFLFQIPAYFQNFPDDLKQTFDARSEDR